MKMAEYSPNGYKTLWEKEKLLVTGNFSFSRSVFKRFVLQTRKNQGKGSDTLLHNLYFTTFINEELLASDSQFLFFFFYDVHNMCYCEVRN